MCFIYREELTLKQHLLKKSIHRTAPAGQQRRNRWLENQDRILCIICIWTSWDSCEPVNQLQLYSSVGGCNTSQISRQHHLSNVMDTETWPFCPEAVDLHWAPPPAFFCYGSFKLTAFIHVFWVSSSSSLISSPWDFLLCLHILFQLSPEWSWFISTDRTVRVWGRFSVSSY